MGKMKHCILMTAYKDVEMINRFIGTIPVEWGIYVHIDKKSDIATEEINSRAIVIKRFKVYWGAWEHLYAFWTLLEMAHQSDNDYDYYHLVTGQDYFGVEPTCFDDLLGPDGTNYLEAFSIPRSGWWDGGEPIFQYRSLASLFDIREGFAKWINVKHLQFQKLFGLKRALPPYPLFSGIMYSSLHRDFVHWMFEEPFAKELLLHLKNTTLAEEVFFSTVIMNSPFKEKCAKKNLRYMVWIPSYPNPELLTLVDYDRITEIKPLFIRKVDVKNSQSLLCRIDNNILQIND